MQIKLNQTRSKCCGWDICWKKRVANKTNCSICMPNFSLTFDEEKFFLRNDICAMGISEGLKEVDGSIMESPGLSKR